jgi:hypothetical protein
MISPSSLRTDLLLASPPLLQKPSCPQRPYAFCQTQLNHYLQDQAVQNKLTQQSQMSQSAATFINLTDPHPKDVGKEPDHLNSENLTHGFIHLDYGN